MRVIAIDGPASSGKSTVARLLAARLGWRCLDTGAMYRAATLAVLRQGVDTSDDQAVCRLLSDLVITLGDGDNSRLVRLNGRDVTEAIRDGEVTANVHHLASNPGVRDWMRREQRKFATGGATVAEGRDMGTVVFPDAVCKIYLDADVNVRAERRRRELQATGRTISPGEILDNIRQRDLRDLNRDVAPLRKAADAVVVDTSCMSIDEAVETCLRIVADEGVT